MDVVNYAEGARRAGVSRNMISKILKLHNNKESEKSYFVFDPHGGKPGINIEDKTWIKYVNKVNKQRSNQTKQLTTTKLQPTESEQPETVNKNDFAMAVYNASKEFLGLSGDKLNQFIKVIERKYELKEGMK